MKLSKEEAQTQKSSSSSLELCIRKLQIPKGQRKLDKDQKLIYKSDLGAGAGKVLVLHVANPGWIPRIPYGNLSTDRKN